MIQNNVFAVGARHWQLLTWCTIRHGVASKRHMAVQRAARQFSADMWKRSSQPVVPNAWRRGRASVVNQPATAGPQQRVQRRE
jgi:hypothetical protein